MEPETEVQKEIRELAEKAVREFLHYGIGNFQDALQKAQFAEQYLIPSF